jgi:hypothetical protein
MEMKMQHTNHSLKVGDILVAEWGYSMALVNFFQVTKLKGKSTVELRELESHEEGTGFLGGVATPKIGQFVKSEDTRNQS